MRKTAVAALVALVLSGPAHGQDPQGKSIRELIGDLRNSDVEIRYQAAFLLGTHGPKAKDAVAPLRNVLKDPDAYVPLVAATSLAMIDPDQIRGAVAILIDGLDDKDEEVQNESALGLLILGPKASQAIAALKKAEPRKGPVGLFARAALAHIGSKHFEKALDILKQVPDEGGTGLAFVAPYYPDALSPLLAALKNKDAEIRMLAAGNLGDLLGPESRKVVPAIKNLLQDPDKRVRLAAAGTLGNLDATQTENAIKLLKAGLRDIDPEVRLAALEGFGGLGKKAKAALGDLRMVQKNDPDQMVRQTAGEIVQVIENLLAGKPKSRSKK